MKVDLVAYTPEPQELLVRAFSKCYQKPANIHVVRKHLKHQSVLEHVNFTFDIAVSRVCWEQLVRHRIASYTAQSHRYTDIEEDDCTCYIPQEIFDLPGRATTNVNEWIEDGKAIYAIYKKWRNLGVSRETARYLAPKGVCIKATVTMNLRSLLKLFTLRLDKHAQEEIRVLTGHMYKLVMSKLPDLKNSLDEIILIDCNPVDKSLFKGDTVDEQKEE